MYEYLQVGKIVTTHGVRGEVKVLPLTDDPKRFDRLKWVYIEINGELKKYDIERVKYHKNSVIVKIKGIDDMNAAEALKNLFLEVDRENAIKLPEDTFFICDLIGCEVYDSQRGRLGVMKNVLSTGSNDVYVVESHDKTEILIPALKSVVTGVNLEERKITVNLPEGLLDEDENHEKKK